MLACRSPLQRLDLRFETLAEALGHRQLRAQRLHRDPGARFDVVGRVDVAHAAFADRLGDTVRAKAFGSRHVGKRAWFKSSGWLRPLALIAVAPPLSQSSAYQPCFESANLDGWLIHLEISDRMP